MQAVSICNLKCFERRNQNILIYPLNSLFLEGKSTVSRLLSNRFDGIVMSTPGAQFLSLRSFFDKQPTPLRRAYYSLGNYAASLEIANALMKSMVVLDRFV